MNARDLTRPTGSFLSTVLSALRGAASGVGIASWFIAEGAMLWRERWRQRQMLGALDDSLLKDIGLSRADVEQERAKPFWRK